MAEMFGSWKQGDQHAQHAVAPMTRWITDVTPNRRVEHHGHNSDYNPAKMVEYEGNFDFIVIFGPNLNETY